ncbi:hypothetical protein LTS14_007058 [Recurvomyces mirabilis]|nr:hypothetical protein LTS14_007058 [Recurvomyces mirabilis]
MAQRGGSSRGQDSAGAALSVPGQSNPQQAMDTDMSNSTNRADSIGRGSKRSFGGRKRDASSGSKRSGRGDGAVNNEKALPAQPAGRAAANPSQPPAAKKKRGFLALLCCSSDDQDTEMQETAQAAKPVARTQPAKVSSTQPAQQTNVSAPGTSATESKEIIDEKAGLPSQSAVNPVIAAAAEPENQAAHDEFSNPVAHSSTAGVAAVPFTPPMHNSIDTQQPVIAAAPITSPNHLDPVRTAGNETTPQVQVQAPTPVVPQSEAENVISDQTPIQRARDEDLEMRDDGVHVPLAPQEAAGIAAGAMVVGGGGVAAAEEIRRHSEGKDSAHEQIPATLPPPPTGPPPQNNVPNSQVEKDYDGAVQSHQDANAPEDNRKWLLPPLRPELKDRKCLVLDLDETLVHSSFKILHQADFTIPVEIEGQYHNVYVIKRPGVDQFLKSVGELYEVVVFTASVSKYGDPLLDQLDIHHVVHHRLFRESCYNHQGNYVKDLSMMGRDLRETIIIDNSPTSYIFHPQHAVPISSWFSDAHDNELLDLIPVLRDLAHSNVTDVSLVLDVAL